jgi:hypothetical protein
MLCRLLQLDIMPCVVRICSLYHSGIETNFVMHSLATVES